MRVAFCLLAACTSSAQGEQELRFTPVIAAGEAYQCFGFEVDEELRRRSLSAIELVASSGAIALHHVALYAAPAPYPGGPVACELMPDSAVELDVWAPGGDPLEMPADVGLALPPNTTSLIVQAHALRLNDGASEGFALRLRFTTSTPPAQAAWLALRAPVPAIRPQHEEVSTALCRVDGLLHLLSTWPHMHRVGAEFHGTIVRASGDREPLVHVVPWNFEDQRAYAIEITLSQGDAVETQCIWRNPTDEYVLPGPLTSDEMCGQSLVAWPAQNARCAP